MQPLFSIMWAILYPYLNLDIPFQNPLLSRSNSVAVQHSCVVGKQQLLFVVLQACLAAAIGSNLGISNLL